MVPNTPPDRKRTHTLVGRTPGIPPTFVRAAPAPDRLGSPSLPPPTAPAILHKGKGMAQEDYQGGKSKAAGASGRVATALVSFVGIGA